MGLGAGGCQAQERRSAGRQVPGLQRPSLSGRWSPTGPGAPGGWPRSQQHASGPGEQRAAPALRPASVLAAPAARGPANASGGARRGRGGLRAAAVLGGEGLGSATGAAGTLAAAGDTRGGMAEAGGAGPPRTAARAPARLPPDPGHRRRELCFLRASDRGGRGGHSRGTRRRRLGPDRREEGAAALRSAGEETGETRRVLRLQGTRWDARNRGVTGGPGPLLSPPPPCSGPPAGTAEVLHSLRALRRCGLHSVPQGLGSSRSAQFPSFGNDES